MVSGYSPLQWRIFPRRCFGRFRDLFKESSLHHQLQRTLQMQLFSRWGFGYAELSCLRFDTVNSTDPPPLLVCVATRSILRFLEKLTTQVALHGGMQSLKNTEGSYQLILSLPNVLIRQILVHFARTSSIRAVTTTISNVHLRNLVLPSISCKRALRVFVSNDHLAVHIFSPTDVCLNILDTVAKPFIGTSRSGLALHHFYQASLQTMRLQLQYIFDVKFKGIIETSLS